MAKSYYSLGRSLSRAEAIAGWCYLPFYLVLLSAGIQYLAAALHVNDAQTRIANYSQWARREDFQAMLRTDEMRGRNRRFNELCRSFEPVMYDVFHVVD